MLFCICVICLLVLYMCDMFISSVYVWYVYQFCNVWYVYQFCICVICLTVLYMRDMFISSVYVWYIYQFCICVICLSDLSMFLRCFFRFWNYFFWRCGIFCFLLCYGIKDKTCKLQSKTIIALFCFAIYFIFAHTTFVIFSSSVH